MITEKDLTKAEFNEKMKKEYIANQKRRSTPVVNNIRLFDINRLKNYLRTTVCNT